jgi:hypothetical protein
MHIIYVSLMWNAERVEPRRTILNNTEFVSSESTWHSDLRGLLRLRAER